MSIDKFLDRSYSATKYNCAHFVCEVWKELVGEEITHMLKGMLTGENERRADLTDLRRVQWMRTPESPSVVLMQRRRCEPHVGIWWNGRVLHLTPEGVHYQPLEIASYGFSKVRFFKC